MLLGTLSVVVLATLAGCGISPMPEPPLVDRGAIQLLTDGMSITVTGAPGAVSPPEATVTVINLDSMEPEMVIMPGPDGSFSTAPFVDLGMMLMPELRIYATAPDGTRSEPIDIVAAPDGTVMPAPRPLTSCLDVPTSLDLGPVAIDDIAIGQIRVHNDCAEPVFLDMVVARLGTDFFATLGVRGAVVVESGRTRNIAVTLEPAGMLTGPVDDVIFLHVSGMAGTVGRRPFDVTGEVTPR